MLSWRTLDTCLAGVFEQLHGRSCKTLPQIGVKGACGMYLSYLDLPDAVLKGYGTSLRGMLTSGGCTRHMAWMHSAVGDTCTTEGS